MTRGHARPRRLLLAVLVGPALVGLATAAVLAQGEALGGKVRSGDAVTIPASETVDHDLYAFGGTVTVDGTIAGDLVVAGGDVSLNGTVEGDVLAAGGTIVIGGTVEGDVRLAGGQVTIGGSVGEDALLGAGQVDIGPGGQVGQDVILAVGQATVRGQVAGNIFGRAGTYQRSGSVGGTEDVTEEEAVAPSPPTVLETIADAVRHFLVVLLVGALAMWLLPRALAASERALRSEPVRAFAWGIAGLVGFVVIIVAIVVLMILAAIILGLLEFDALVAFAVIGGLIAIAGLSVVLVFIAAYIVDAVVGLALGRLAMKGVGAGPTEEARASWTRDLGLLALGAAVVVILTWLPVVGGLLKLLVFLLGLGSLLAVAWSMRRRGQPSPAIPAPAGWPPPQP